MFPVLSLDAALLVVCGAVFVLLVNALLMRCILRTSGKRRYGSLQGFVVIGSTAGGICIGTGISVLGGGECALMAFYLSGVMALCGIVSALTLAITTA